MAEFTSPAAVRKTVTFTLDGRDYDFAAPKTASLLLGLASTTDNIGRLAASVDWLTDGLSTEDADHIVSRLHDPADGFDVTTLMEVVKHLIAEVADRPTG